jgi:hypothetical protein
MSCNRRHNTQSGKSAVRGYHRVPEYSVSAMSGPMYFIVRIYHAGHGICQNPEKPIHWHQDIIRSFGTFHVRTVLQPLAAGSLSCMVRSENLVSKHLCRHKNVDTPVWNFIIIARLFFSPARSCIR